MLRNRCIVGVIGGDESAQVGAARQVGAEIAKVGQIILTGGTPVNTNDVKNAALWGAHQAEKTGTGSSSVRARMIGILNSEQVDWNTPHPCRLFLKTGLTSFERDAINGLTPDVLIVFQGGEELYANWPMVQQRTSRFDITDRSRPCGKSSRNMLQTAC
jgi:predicted Rossmann-fold nucleotide-binding protein